MISSTSGYSCAILVRKDLPMTKGKIVAQCGHAIVQAITNISQDKLQLWRNDGEKIVVLQVPNLSTMEFTNTHAHKKNIFSHIVIDAGHTQIPENTSTVCIIGPDTHDKIHTITKQYKLL